MPNKPALTARAASLLIDVQIAIAAGNSDRAVEAAREAAKVVEKMNANRLHWVYEVNHGSAETA